MTNLKWIGDKINCYDPSLVGDDFEFYGSFSYNNEKFQIGEFALFSCSNKDGIPRIGRLLCVCSSREEPRFRGLVQWYSWACRISPQLYSRRIKLDHRNEIIEDEMDDETFLKHMVSLEDIQKKCEVIYASSADSANLIKINNLNSNIYFFCRYKIENNTLVPVSSQNGSFVNKEDYILATELKHKLNISFLTECSSQKKTPTKQEHDSNYLKTPTSLNPLGFEEVNKIKNSLSTMSHLTLTPRNDRYASLIKRKSSVKRVLNDSFGDSPTSPSGIPIFSYSIVNSTVDSDSCGHKKNIKMKFKLNKNQNCNNKNSRTGADLRVHITKLDEEVFKLKSPIKMHDLQKINPLLGQSPSRSLRLKTPSKIDSIRRSSRTIERKSYVEYSSPEKTPTSTKKTTYRNRNLRGGKTPLSGLKNDTIPRSTRRNIMRPKYLDENFIDYAKDSPRTPKSKKMDQSSDNEESGAKRTNLEQLETQSQKNSTSSPTRRSKRQLSITAEENTDKKPRINSLHKDALMNSCKKSTRKLDDNDSDFDDESFTLKTPKKRGLTKINKNTPKSTPGSKAKMIREGMITPSVQTREIGLVKDNTPLSKARTQLHVSYVPDSLPCREREFTDIMGFLQTKLLDGCGGCMYVSGVPGTGKTATVTEVIRTLQNAASKREIPSFTYINVNGLKLSEPRQAYVEIIKQLTGKIVHWDQAQTMLEKKFIKTQKKTSSPIILIVDELDILCTKRQDVVYNLLDWPTKGHCQLIVVTIANTMDLPERLLMGRVTSRLGLTRLSFQPYNHKQLQEIVQKRLSGISAFNPDAVQLVARKVASVSGDARRALDICRRSVEIAELEGKPSLVSLTHVNQALSAMITQPKVRAIKCCSRLEKLVLQAVVAEVERTGVEETTFSRIFKMLITLAALDGFKMVSSTVALASVSRLGLSRLLLTDQKCSNIDQKIILNVSVDDVYYALMKTGI